MERDNNRKRLESKKEKNKLVNLNIKENRRLKAQCMAQVDDERGVRKAIESNMSGYQNRTHALRE